MMADSLAFSVALMQELMGNVTNWYGADNWDSDRFGPHKSSFKSLLITKLNELSAGRLAIVPRDISSQIHKLTKIQPSIDKLSWLYNRLADEFSKSMLVKIVAYRVMGHKKVKFPLNTDNYWIGRESTRDLIKTGESIRIGFRDWVLNRFELRSIGYPIEVFFSPSGVFATFMLRQYEYGKRTPAIKAQEGDYVIDAGGCWGDTALYFANSTGQRGKVYAFEFVDENLEVFKRNLALNPQLSSRVAILKKALWNKSCDEIAYCANGPGTCLNGGEANSLRVLTVTIDDFVKQEKLPRVDFIKMDIEGAELPALKGGQETIRTFKPRLAISVYHKENDLVDIPLYLDSLGVGYQFFLDHFTIHQEETVLFAIPSAD